MPDLLELDGVETCSRKDPSFEANIWFPCDFTRRPGRVFPVRM